MKKFASWVLQTTVDEKEADIELATRTAVLQENLSAFLLVLGFGEILFFLVYVCN